MLSVLILTALPGLLRLCTEKPLELGGREQAQALMRLYDFSVMRELAACPPSLVISGICTLSTLPLVTLLLAFDMIARERELGTLRFSGMRARWSAIIIGRTLAAWLVYVGTCLLSYSPVWSAEIALRRGLQFEAFGWGGRLYFVICIQALAFVSLWMLVSCACRRAWVSLAVGVGLIFIMGLLRRALHTGAAIGRLSSCLLGTVDELLLGSNAGLHWVGIAIACTWILCALTTAAVCLNRVRV